MEIKKYLEAAFESCAKSVLRLNLVSAPLIGSHLDVLFTEADQLRKELLLQKTLEELDENKVDKDYLKSDEFKNILIQTLEICIKEIYENKISYYAKLLKNSLESDESGRRYNIDLIKTLSELSIEQLYILKELYCQQKNIVNSKDEEILSIILDKTEWNELPKILKEKYDINLEEIYFLLKRTENTGLIHEINGSFIEYAGGVFKIDKMLPKLMDKLDIIE